MRIVIWEYHTEKRQVIQERRIIGRTLSTTSISLPSRLRIRPVGVLSKNDIGLWRTCCSVLWKRRLEAITVPLARNSAIANTVTPIMITVMNFDLSDKMTDYISDISVFSRLIYHKMPFSNEWEVLKLYIIGNVLFHSCSSLV